MIERHVLSDASIALAGEWIPLRAYGRSLLVYKIYQLIKFHSRETSIVGAARC